MCRARYRIAYVFPRAPDHVLVIVQTARAYLPENSKLKEDRAPLQVQWQLKVERR